MKVVLCLLLALLGIANGHGYGGGHGVIVHSKRGITPTSHRLRKNFHSKRQFYFILL
jgi:hypothetical protein